ncbi:metal ABC transporter ATP-binding protein [Saccharomonospora viridis]|jgi:manganese/zinc/iron transport system ATP- binding protein|uniref:ATPase component of Mn/Zn ABC-type transporter n=2 Tax=Saccharomonospora viridis TaxID=1852 RepID=C7MTE9_SACVD|nr:metal ABC transporter ATP-binding protein [Saccharomonospora viridis]ACU95419.1 ATPase component of Mn/Zn ABC-type transporter [Saccharomonospora viridis DSM 43017]KHF45053.1 manganese ABC transporter ATP-binding protein [Saccharomonospora viridis]SFP14550.1 manganese/zinc/iron transport system ATP-binding protein [Saccharomonospora viridis]
MTPTFGSAPSGTRPHKTTPALSLVDFSASYGGRNVLSGVTVDIPSAALAAVVGPNGAGKSTLVKAALGLVPSTQGRVRLLGQPLSRVRRKVAYVPQQDSVTKDFPITAVQVVEMGRYPHRGWWRRLTPTDDELVAQAMEQVGVVDLADRPIDELSGGQRQRVFLARALAQRAELVVLDEPFTAVDARTESALLDVLTNLCREGVSVIVVHHDLRTVLRRFDHAVLLAGGVVADGPVADVLTAENLERAYGIAPLVLDS